MKKFITFLMRMNEKMRTDFHQDYTVFIKN